MVHTTELLIYSSLIKQEHNEKQMEFWEVKKMFENMYFLLPKNYDETSKSFSRNTMNNNILSSSEYINKFGKYGNMISNTGLLTESSIKELVDYLMPFDSVMCYFTVNLYLTCDEYNYTIRVNSDKTSIIVVITITNMMNMSATDEITLYYSKK